MSWTYEPTLIAASAMMQVRLAIGDILPSAPQLQDEEINYFLSIRSTINGACAECCRSLAARYSRSVDMKAGDNSRSFSQMAKAYSTQAAIFESKAAMGGAAVPYAGGISVADKMQQEQNPDRVSPQFNIGMDDNDLPVPSGGNQTQSQGSG